MEERNKKLEKENAQLLQRWLDKMNQEAEKMNEATQFYERQVKHGLEWVHVHLTPSSVS